MAIGSSFTTFEGGSAFVQVNYDDVAMEMVSIVYSNNSGKTATVEINQPPNRNDVFTVSPGAGVPAPITQNIPHNRYTYHPDPKGGVAQDFTTRVTFR